VETPSSFGSLASFFLMKPYSNMQIRKLKGLAQQREALLSMGKEGLSPAFLQAVEAALALHELVKIRFSAHKDEKDALAAELAEKTGAFLVTRLGHTAVLYRPAVEPTRRKITV
jgi:RNA-binding protein